ncbi:hypothetical protein D3C80_2047580 [compost metagenome]
MDVRQVGNVTGNAVGRFRYQNLEVSIFSILHQLRQASAPKHGRAGFRSIVKRFDDLRPDA